MGGSKMHYQLYFSIVALQLLCALLALSRGYPIHLVALIFFTPILGPFAYLVYENITALRYRFQKLTKNFNKGSADKALAKLQHQVRYHPTIENQHQLAKHYMQMGQFNEAIKLLDNVLAQKTFRTDPHLLLDKAQAYFSMEEYESAHAQLDFLVKTNPQFHCLETQLLMARTLSALGHDIAATRAFEALESHYHGLEASFYYLKHLAKFNNKARAKEIFGRMQRRFERLPAHFRSSQKGWLKQARRENR